MKKNFKVGQTAYLAFDYDINDGGSTIETGRVKVGKECEYVINDYGWMNNDLLFHTYNEAVHYVLNSYKDNCTELSVENCLSLMNVIGNMKKKTNETEWIEHYALQIIQSYHKVDQFTENLLAKLGKAVPK